MACLTEETCCVEAVRENNWPYLLIFFIDTQVGIQLFAAFGCRDGRQPCSLCVCECVRASEHVFEPDALLTGAGLAAAARYCFRWQRLAAPRGPCHKESSVTH